MLTGLNTENDLTPQVLPCAAAGGVYQSADAQSNEDEKVQSSQIPKVDSVEISSQARASMSLGTVVAASPKSGSAQTAQNSGKETTPAAYRNTEAASADLTDSES